MDKLLLVYKLSRVGLPYSVHGPLLLMRFSVIERLTFRDNSIQTTGESVPRYKSRMTPLVSSHVNHIGLNPYLSARDTEYAIIAIMNSILIMPQKKNPFQGFPRMKSSCNNVS